MVSERKRIPMEDINSFRFRYSVSRDGNASLIFLARQLTVYVQSEGEENKIVFRYDERRRSPEDGANEFFSPMSRGTFDYLMAGAEVLDVGDGVKFRKERPSVASIKGVDNRGITLSYDRMKED